MSVEDALGRLFVFEGPDGVGKTTLISHLRCKLEALDLLPITLSFPGNDLGTLGRLVYDLHHDSALLGVKRIPALSLQLMHVAAHIDAIDNQIVPSLHRGQFVLLDRFWWSTVAYGRLSGIREDCLQSMIQLEKTCWGSYKPAMVFLLDVELPHRPGEACKEWQSLRRLYIDLAEQECQEYPVSIINNSGPIDDTISCILDHICCVARKSQKGQRRNPDPSKMKGHSARSSRGSDCWSPAKPTQILDAYWKFASARQEIFFRRVQGLPPPWTGDPILRKYKFTNAYRASDRVSQFLIRHVIYGEHDSQTEVFFRTLLFKFFNRIETWNLLQGTFGTISYKDFSYRAYDRILSGAMAKGVRIYSSAYIMPTGGKRQTYKYKHQMHLQLLEQMMRDELPDRIADARSMGEAFEMLHSYPTIGDFLAYQFVTDLNYSEITDFSEMEFVAPGPGARSGIRKCFTDLGGLTEAEIIRMVAQRQEEEFHRLGMQFQSLWGRRLQLIDCQNLFCELDKYARVAYPKAQGISGRHRIKHRFSQSTEPITYWYPPKWNINEKIRSSTKTIPYQGIPKSERGWTD